MLLPTARLLRIAALVITAQFLAPQSAYAQFAQQGAKIVAPLAPDPDAAIGLARFGSTIAVSADGNTAIVGGPKDGAPGHDDNGVGAAWIYVRDNAGNWTEQKKLVGSTLSTGQNQGYSVTISADGNIAVVGGPAIDDPILQTPPFTANNATWVFRRTGTSWDSGTKIVANSDSMHQGQSVAISGNGSTIAVGDPMDGIGAGNVTGAVFIFIDDHSGGWTLQQKLIGNDAIGNASQGSSVALSANGNTVLIGGPSDHYDPDNSGFVGAAWVFTRSGGVWTQQQKLVGTGYIDPPRLGSSVALSANGNTAILGGPQDGFPGAVWSFTRSGATWTQQGRMVGTGSLGYAFQGLSVAVSTDGNALASGGYFHNSGQGATWIFNRTAGAWAQQGGKLRGTGGINGPYGISQGRAVALSADANTLLVGAPDDDSEKGAAWVFVQTPAITSILPNRGTLAGGTSVVIRGTGFNGASGVTFGGVAATDVVVAGPTMITATTPAHAEQVVDVAVIGVMGTDIAVGAYTYSDLPPAPDVHSVTPNRGPHPGGTAVTILGANFTDASAVQFGGTNAASFEVKSASRITAVTPAHANGAVNVSVTGPGGTDALSSAFTFFTPPVITGLSPKSAEIAGNVNAVITGTNLTGATQVKFGGTAALFFTVDSATQITAGAPAHAAGIVDVVVTVPAGDSAPSAATKFTYLAPSAATSLYKFKGGATDGARPIGWLTPDKAGNLYGVTYAGGPGGDGTVFMLSPPAPPNTAWARTILHFFDGTHGGNPGAGLVADKNGRLYGTTLSGPPPGFAGVVYRLTPPAASNARAKWTYEVLYTLKGGAGGSTPYGGVVLDRDGNVYGIARDGGPGGAGFLYKLAPTATPPWPRTILHNFTGAPGPTMAQGGLRLDADGVLWGTSTNGGKYDKGTVFKYMPPAARALPKPVVLYSFKDSGGDGTNPYFSGLPVDAGGNMYGSASQGGAAGSGAVFMLTPKPPENTAFKESVIFDPGTFGGYLPAYGVTLGKNGTLFGTAALGGTYNGGVLFRLSPPIGNQTSWSARALHNFGNSNDPLGKQPNSELLLKNNVIYGVTAQGGGGACDCGAVFMIKE